MTICSKCGNGYDGFIQSKKCPHPVEDPEYWDRGMKRLKRTGGKK